MKRSRNVVTDLLGDSADRHTAERPEPENWFEQNEAAMQRAPTGKHARHTGRQPVEIRVDIGPRPEGCTKEVWHELANLHRGLGHPANTSLARMLARHGCRPEILEFVRMIECSICIELSRPQSKPLSGSQALRILAFRDMVAVDEFFVALTDGYRVTLVLIMDVASRLAVTYPILRPTMNIKAEELVEAVERAWLSWAGAMKTLRGDPAKPHIAEGVELAFLPSAWRRARHHARREPRLAGHRGTTNAGMEANFHPRQSRVPARRGRSAMEVELTDRRCHELAPARLGLQPVPLRLWT